MNPPEHTPELPPAVAVLNAVLRRRRLLLLSGFAGALLAGLAGFLRRPFFEATSSFVPHASESNLGALSGMAAQLGVALPSGGAAGDSPEFYVELVKTRSAIAAVAFAQYDDPRSDGQRQATLLQLLGSDVTSRDSVMAARRAIDNLIDARYDAVSGIVALKTRSPWPSISEAMNTNLLRFVDAFNRERRQARAEVEGEFTVTRLAEAKVRLQAAEEAAAAFLQRNRQFHGSPALELEYARLQRAVAHEQQIFSSLAVAADQLRLEALKSSPVISIVESPQHSAERRGRRILLNAVVGGALGLVIALTVMFFRSYNSRQRQRYAEEYDEFDRLLAGTLGKPRRRPADEPVARA